jgi:signal transduction histidine kinase/HAMP domain-containing protein
MFKTSGKLNRKLTLMLYGVLTLTSLLFLVLLVGAYKIQLQAERGRASSQLNMLLGATLENAMLKRDLEGLRAIVDRLGEQPDIIDVSILNPAGEVRFSSNPKKRGKMISGSLDAWCDGCEGDFSHASITTRFTNNDKGISVLRSVNPVHNKPPCAVCHGDPAAHPVNGVLVVDYDATPIMQKAMTGLLGMLAAGFVVMLLTLGTVWWFIRKDVLNPVTELDTACQHLAQGDLAFRSRIRTEDEFGSLSKNFNTMAERLENSLIQLLEKETYLQGLIDAFPDGIRVIDENFITVNANNAYKEMLHLGDDSLVGEFCYKSSYQKSTPCPPTLITCPVHEIAQNPVPIKTMHEYVTANGSFTKVQVFAAPMTVEVDGRQRRYVVESVRDLMKDIHFSHEHKLSALGQLAAGVGHEIRNPLSSIRLALDSVLKKLHAEENINPHVIEYLELVDGEIDKCLDITGRLLKMSSLPGEECQLVAVNISVRETVSLVHYEGEKQDIEISLHFDESEPRVFATETDVRIVVLNLVQNAFHAMPNGGKLDIATRVAGEHVELLFSDTGVGIPAENLPHIFEPFYTHRADGKKGIGLGLTICQSIVDRYHGAIGVEPAGAGFNTCFKVTLPRVME